MKLVELLCRSGALVLTSDTADTADLHTLTYLLLKVHLEPFYFDELEIPQI